MQLQTFKPIPKFKMYWRKAHIMSYSAGIPQFFIEEVKYTNRP